MKNSTRILAMTALVAALGQALAEDASPFVGRWAFTTPGGGAGWLGITQEDGYVDGSILWEGGSVVPVSAVFVMDDSLYVTRVNEIKRKDASGKVVRTQQMTEAIVARVDGDRLEMMRVQPKSNGLGVTRETFAGRRIPALPPKPDLANVKFGAPIQLFNGQNLEGWRLTSPGQVSGWRAENGILVNEPKQEEGKPHISYGNLRTDREFEDFNLTLEAKVLPRGNSGIYLRGIYEVQVEDSYGKGLDSHHMGGIYSRITPTMSAEKPAGEWQSYDITLVNRHVTVVLNGKKIIDNQPLLGCTGGALWSDESRPGPIYLQGDHTGVNYRNIVIRPVQK